MGKLNQIKKDIKIIVCVLLMLSGYILNAYDLLFNIDFSIWVDSYCFKQDLQYLGAVLLGYHLCSFERLKLKTFLFMLTAWQIFVLILNPLEIYNIYFLSIPSIIYGALLLRIYFIKAELIEYTNLEVLKRYTTYNIFIPVHSFRGLVQALFCFWRDPRYETTIFIDKNKMHYVKNQVFWVEEKKTEVIERLINKTSAKVSVKYADKKQMKKINNLTTKRAITGLRDCRKLVIKGTT